MTTYDALLQAYLDAQDALKRAEEAKEELRVLILAEAPHNQSERFKVAISESTSERLEGIKAIADKSPSLLEALHAAGCVKTVTSTRLTVKPIGGVS